MACVWHLDNVNVYQNGLESIASKLYATRHARMEDNAPIQVIVHVSQTGRDQHVNSLCAECPVLMVALVYLLLFVTVLMVGVETVASKLCVIPPVLMEDTVLLRMCATVEVDLLIQCQDAM